MLRMGTHHRAHVSPLCICREITLAMKEHVFWLKLCKASV